MKTLYSLFVLCLTINLTAQSNLSSYKNKEDGKVHLLGEITHADLQIAPYKTWYDSIYQAYALDTKTIEHINKNYDDDIKVKIFLGTWCGDSKQEVTRFYKIAAQSKINVENIELICLDARSEHYKQGPNGEEKGYNIHRVPTFIFHKNDQEVARIVEHPVNSLEMDLAQIYAGLPSEPKYRLANEIGQLFDEKTVVEVDSFLNQNIKILKGKTSELHELNTYGFVLLYGNEIEKAKVVFKFNTKLFPKSGYAYYSLARAYTKSGETELATENFMKSLKLDPELGYVEKRLKEMVADLAKK